MSKRLKYCCVVSFSVFLVTLGFDLYVSNRATIKGKDLQGLYVEKEQLEKDIALLKYEDSNLSSLVYVQQRARDIGFVEMKDPLATISSLPLASLTNTR